MSPEERRAQILDAAVDLMVKTGHSGCSLEQIAKHAQISKPLIYKYFPNREVLLKALLKREFAALSGSGLDSIPKKVPIEKVIRSTVGRALRYYHEHGPILRILASDPGVASLTQEGNRSSRRSTSDYFVRQLKKQFKVPDDVAIIAVTMVVNAPIQSMAYLRRQNIDIERTIDVWTTFIVGGWQALQQTYGQAPSN